MVPLITEIGIEDSELFRILTDVRKLEAMDHVLDRFTCDPPFIELCDFLEEMIPAFVRINKEVADCGKNYDQKEQLRKLTVSDMTDRQFAELLLMRKLDLPE